MAGACLSCLDDDFAREFCGFRVGEGGASASILFAGGS